MYKITRLITKNGLILVRRQLSDGRTSAIIVMRTPSVRQYSDKRPPPPAQTKFGTEQCPPPPPRPKSKLLITTVGATLLAGAAIVYAKNSPDTRNWISANAPMLDKLITVVYQEKLTYKEFTADQWNSITSKLSGFLFGKEGVEPLPVKQRADQDLEKDAKEGYKNKDYVVLEPILEPLYVPVTKKLEPVTPDEPGTTVVQTEQCDPPAPLKVNVSKSIVEMEKQMNENMAVAMNSFKKATEMSEKYNSLLGSVIMMPLDAVDKKIFADLKSTSTERENYITKAKNAAEKAQCAIDVLETTINSNNLAAPPENLSMIKRYAKKYREDLDQAIKKFEEELENSNVAKLYWDKVESARAAYKDVLDILFPDLDLSAPRLELKGDTDALLMFTLRQVQYLQNRIAELETIKAHQIARALECHDDKALIEAKVDETLAKERQKREAEYQLLVMKLMKEHNNKMKDHLKRQYDHQQILIELAVKKKEAELTNKFNRTISEEVEKERIIVKKELAILSGKLRAIEYRLRQKKSGEAAARQSLTLWAAAEALLAAIKRPDDVSKIEKEIKAIENAGKGDGLVASVLKGINPEVVKEGVATENAIRERFGKMEKYALQVALIGNEGATLPMYFLSWLQSKLLFNKFAEIPRDELEDFPTDFSKLDTFDIIQRARYYMDQGKLDTALRYVNLLQGAPRAVSQGWADAARRHLEIKQAAETVMAHASLAGLFYV